jgi:hypothetical protein
MSQRKGSQRKQRQASVPKESVHEEPLTHLGEPEMAPRAVGYTFHKAKTALFTNPAGGVRRVERRTVIWI